METLKKVDKEKPLPSLKSGTENKENMESLTKEDKTFLDLLAHIFVSRILRTENEEEIPDSKTLKPD